MSDDEELYYGKHVDEDYIDVEKERADLSVDEDNSTDNEQYYDETVVDHADTSHRFDVSDGNGAASELDELIDQNAVIENDGRSKTRTFFYPDEAAESSQHRFKRLIRWQDGERDPSRREQNRIADRKRWIETFGTQLSITTYQIERTKSIVESVNMSHMAHFASEQVILAIMSIVANEDGRFIRDEDEFRSLMTHVNVDEKEIRTIRDMVKDKSELL